MRRKGFASVFASTEFARKATSFVCAFPTEKRDQNFSCKAFPEIRRYRVGIVEFSSCDIPFRLWIEHHHVRVKSRCEAALSFLQTSQLRRAFRHPTHDINKRKASTARFRPHQREGQRHARNSAPCVPELPSFHLLHRRRARRITYRDKLNYPFANSPPTPLALP